MENQQYKSTATFKKPEVYIHCPFCGEGEHRVDHLFDYARDPKKSPGGFFAAGPWHCKNIACLRVFDLQVFADESVQTIETERDTNEIYAPVYVLLRRGDLFILLDAHTHIDRTAYTSGEPMCQEKQDQIRYYYEEHTCPTNWMQGCVHMLSLDGDIDPHGAFDFVRAMTYPEVWKGQEARQPSTWGHENEDVLTAAFPELRMNKRDNRVKALVDLNVPLDVANLVIDSGRQGFAITGATLGGGESMTDSVRTQYFHMKGLPASAAGQAAFDAWLRRYWGQNVFVHEGELCFTVPYVVVGDGVVGGLLVRTKTDTGELLSVDLIAETSISILKPEDQEQIRSKITKENEAGWSHEVHFGVTIERKFVYPKLEVGQAPLPSYFMEE